MSGHTDNRNQTNQSTKRTIPLNRYWYGASISAFLQANPDEILGQLAHNAGHQLLHSQTTAWEIQIDFLQPNLVDLGGWVYFEYNIPRMGKRIDVVLVCGAAIFAIEFKTGEADFNRGAIEQAWDYALDLKNFHETSHSTAIIPILVATAATSSPPVQLIADADQVYHPINVHPGRLREAILQGIASVPGPILNPEEWSSGAYLPTPTIIEAARALYSRHSVDAIARYDAGAINLRLTSHRIDELVDMARQKQKKVICFVTGVPGAGKTLVGLNVATRHRKEEEPTHAVFLSGNGPLVEVLVEALTRDECARLKGDGIKTKKSTVKTSVKAFIQNVHHFRDEALIDLKPPIDHVAIFDEAQRAWNLKQTRKFMEQKKNQRGFSQSEPEFLISYMDRHPDWATIVCLVGGGQEINTGEAGISAWIQAVIEKFPRWEMYISSTLTDAEFSNRQNLESAAQGGTIHYEEHLHLAVSMRSFRAENVSEFVKAILDCEIEVARASFQKVQERYPIAVTRNLERAKEWIRGQARGSERFGMVASSKAMRLKPHAIDIRVQINPVHYFLNDRDDTRSSYYLEDAATEFQVQGLEMDWVCVNWDGDLRHSNDFWTFHNFRGAKWENIRDEDIRRYTLNAYRVLLTRARQGMIIFIPAGDAADPTRLPAFYDATFNYLRQTGIPLVD